MAPLSQTGPTGPTGTAVIGVTQAVMAPSGPTGLHADPANDDGAPPELWVYDCDTGVWGSDIGSYLDRGELGVEVFSADDVFLGMSADVEQAKKALRDRQSRSNDEESGTTTSEPDGTTTPEAAAGQAPVFDPPAKHEDILALRLRLLENGFDPVIVSGKAAVMTGWPHLQPTAERLREWTYQHPGATNTGNRARNAPALDIDIMHQAAAEAVEVLARRHFGGRGDIHVRIGLPPKRLIPLRADSPFRKLTRVFTAPVGADGKPPKIEILGDGQQYVVDGIHPDTRKPYRWMNGAGGMDVRDIARDGLPLVTAEDCEAFLADAAKLLVEQFGFVEKEAKAGAAAGGGKAGAAIERIARAFRVIPNDDADWDDWCLRGMACYAATGGSEAGYEIWRDWSAKSQKKHEDRTTFEKWHSKFKGCPPHCVGAGSIFFWANQIDPNWDERYTDLGNARRLVRLHGDNIRYVAAWKSWLVWRDGHWRRDDDGEIMRLAKATVEAMYAEAMGIADEGVRNALRKHALKCQAAARLAAMVELAKTERAVILPVARVDTDPLLLGVENGVIDLRTGSFRPAEREDYVTKRCGVAFDPKAKCPNWDAFLRRIFNAAPKPAEIAAAETEAAKARAEAEAADIEATKAEAKVAKAEAALVEADAKAAEAQAREMAEIEAAESFKMEANLAAASAELVKFQSDRNRKWARRNKTKDEAQEILDKKMAAEARATVAESEVERLKQAPGTAVRLMAYIRRACGYTLTGLTDEEVMFILWNTGNNGKSTLRETIFALMGDYAMAADASLLVAHNKQQGGATPDVARMHGKRLVTVNETQEGDHLNESRVKFITSHDTTTARFLYENPFDFTPTHKTMLTTNKKPIIKGTDLGIWRRVQMWPFLVTIPEQERDRHFRQKRLMPELPGILNWALRGLRKYHLLGLKPPPVVIAATEEYREDMDVIGQWINERIVLDPTSARKRTELYADYKIWSEANVGWCLKAIGFGRELAQRKDLGLTEMWVGGDRGWRGVRLRSPTPLPLFSRFSR
jgi:putative DNA primase/helicase